MPCPLCKKEHAYTINQALASLGSTARRLERATKGLSPKRAVTPPAPGKWSVKEIICHLADCELVYGLRYRIILAEPEAKLSSFDQEAWAENLYYKQRSLNDTLGAFKIVRASNLSLLKKIPPRAWKKTGQHESYGTLTLEQIVRHIVDHDRNHTAQVEHAARKGEK